MMGELSNIIEPAVNNYKSDIIICNKDKQWMQKYNFKQTMALAKG